MGKHTPEDKSLWHYLSRSVSIAVLLLILALGAAVVAIPRVAGAIPLTVLTSSMEPKLPPGTLIVVRPVAIDDIRVGDVVTYQIHSGVPGVISHRVIAIALAADGGRTFILKGDNNSVPDVTPVIPEQVQGKLWYSVPYVGFANTALSGNTRAWVVPVGGVLLLLYAAITFTRGIIAARRKDLPEREVRSDNRADDTVALRRGR